MTKFDFKPYSDKDSDRICGKCGGLGYVQITGNLILNSIFDMSADCTRCGGTGFIGEEPQ